MHADAAVTGLSRTPATTARNTVQPLADVVNVTLKSKSGQTANHIEGRSFANVLQWSISALGAALLASAIVTGALQNSALAGSGTRLATASSAGVFGTTTAAAFGLASGTGTANNVTMWSGTSTIGDAPGFTYVTGDGTYYNIGPAIGLNVTGLIETDTGFSTTGGMAVYGNSLFGGSVSMTVLAGTGTRLVTATSAGVLGSTTAASFGLVSGTGTANKIAYWSGTDTLTSSSGFGYDGTNVSLSSGNFNINGATNVSGIYVHVLAGSIAVTRAAGAGGAVGSYGLGSPAVTDWELMQFFHNGTNGLIRVLQSGTGSYRDMLIQNAGATQINVLATGGITVSNAAAFSSTIAVTGTSTFTGRIAVGTLSASVAMRLSAATLTGADQFGIVSEMTFSSAATSNGRALQAQLITAASSFTMTSGYGLYVASPSKGSGSTITTAYGIRVDDQSAGGTNYAIRTGLGQTLFGDIVGIGSANSAYALKVANVSLTGVFQYGIVVQTDTSSAATSQGTGIYAQVRTAAASFTQALSIGIQIDSPNKGSGSAMTSLYGLKVETQTAGTSNNWAIYTDSGKVRFGDFVLMDTTAVSQFLLNSSGANYGTIQNDAANTWSLGYKTSFSNALGTVALKWNSSGTITIPGTLSVTGAITATGGIVFNGGGTNLNHYETGSFTATLTGCTTSPTGTVFYTRVGNKVTISIPQITAVSNTTSATLTGMPASIRPARDKCFASPMINNGIFVEGNRTGFYVLTTGVIEMWLNSLPIGFSSSSTKGFAAGLNSTSAADGRRDFTYDLA